MSNTIQEIISFEESMLNDFLSTPRRELIAGVDSPEDVVLHNYMLGMLDKKISALRELSYLKHSSVLLERPVNPVGSKIRYDYESNALEVFLGDGWKTIDNGLNTSISVRENFTINDFSNNLFEIDGIQTAIVNTLTLKTELNDTDELFIIADGILVPKNFYTVENPLNKKQLTFIKPIQFSNSLEYYIMTKSNELISIPKYETNFITADGSTNRFLISKNDYFVATARSSIEVFLNKNILYTHEFSLDIDNRTVLLNFTPKPGDEIFIKTLYGVATDFTNRLGFIDKSYYVKVSVPKLIDGVINPSYVKELTEIPIDITSDSVIIFLNGIRLTKSVDYVFDYLNKKIIFDKRLLTKDINQYGNETLYAGSIITVVQEYINYQTPSYGRMKFVTLQVINNTVTIDDKIENTDSCIIFKDTGIVIKPSYYTKNFNPITGKTVIIFNSVLNLQDLTNLNINYYVNTKTIPLQEILKINDNSNSDTDVTWSANKIANALNSKAFKNGSGSESFTTNSLTSFGDVDFKETLTIGDSLLVKNTLKVLEAIKISDANGSIFEVNKSGDLYNKRDLLVGRDGVVGGNFTVNGNLVVKGAHTEVVTETVLIADNIVTLNSNVDTTTEPTENSGIEINRGVSPNSFLIWDEMVDNWVCGTEGDLKEISRKGHSHSILDIENLKSADVGFVNGRSVNDAVIDESTLWTSKKITGYVDSYSHSYTSFINPNESLAKSGDIKIENGKAYIRIGTVWNQIYPAIYNS